MAVVFLRVVLGKMFLPLFVCLTLSTRHALESATAERAPRHASRISLIRQRHAPVEDDVPKEILKLSRRCVLNDKKLIRVHTSMRHLWFDVVVDFMDERTDHFLVWINTDSSTRPIVGIIAAFPAVLEEPAHLDGESVRSECAVDSSHFPPQLLFPFYFSHGLPLFLKEHNDCS